MFQVLSGCILDAHGDFAFFDSASFGPVVDCMDCMGWKDVATKFSSMMAVIAVMAETIICCLFYRRQQYRLLQCCPPLYSAFYYVFRRPVLNSQCKMLLSVSHMLKTYACPFSVAS